MNQQQSHKQPIPSAARGHAHAAGGKEHLGYGRQAPRALSHSPGRMGKTRAIISAEQAEQIYQLGKSSVCCADSFIAGNANAVAAKFCISSKAVRDIWKRRTWTEATQHLWMKGEAPVLRSRRRMMLYAAAYTCRPASYIIDSESQATSSSSSSDHEDFYCTLNDWQWECGTAPLALGEDPFAGDKWMDQV
mmetsp:Transcript_20241/g.56077  ORF Transcript_20241/g.56077 Transcript_20241/m.56077 type:complete len:191 (-) Transcript_20241:58-630(-)|eukprot:CAMPEP_0113688366 /NCGR_PEP_ID=MMETSP0038_2-20120614/16487_1 /TAXON_ID=2898 /ORGANISM="Cryptomonas paramecium" /LENGTH=190 /DNA_ID=CAMNT_0000609155 /DNA_START=131 /DNA_END=703 /DNA_ORIENTATION=+ /assembly_acc=CAM_ASM_000170